MVVYEYLSLVALELEPAVVHAEEVLGVGSVVLPVAHHGAAVLELGYDRVGDSGVVSRLHRLPACPDYLEVCGRIAGLAEDGLDVARLHVLGSVDTESVNAHAHEVLEVSGDLVLGARVVGCDIRHSLESAVADGPGISVVDRAVVPVEVICVQIRVRRIVLVSVEV